MKLEEQATVRDRIILATVNCIERDGLEAVTVRAIAKEAEVNTAAVNYYFGTKERLIQAALSRTLEEGFLGSLGELEQLIAARGGDVRAALREFFIEFFGYMVRWPRITEAQMHDALARQDYGGPAILRTNEYFERFLALVQPALPTMSESDQRHAVLQLWLPLMFVGMLPGAFARFAGADAADPEWRRGFVESLVDGVFGGAP
jgi:AcrR family transcriptional regulator